MTRVVQIQRQGKVKDASAPAAASGLPAEEIETKVALIQALNPLGLHTVSEALEGPRCCLGGGTLLSDGRARRRGPLWAVTRLGLLGRSETAHPPSAGAQPSGEPRGLPDHIRTASRPAGSRCGLVQEGPGGPEGYEFPSFEPPTNDTNSRS